MRHVLMTGTAGFIGSHTAERLLANGDFVTGIDAFDFSEPHKTGNLSTLREHKNFRFIGADIRMPAAFAAMKAAPDLIVHLAATSGVRSPVTPVEYYDNNVRGTLAVLELARLRGIKHVVFASSSSVYGTNPRTPWRESDTDLRPISHYAATKISCEILCRLYSEKHRIGIANLRFFTVFGPRQRPDLAIHRIVDRITKGKPVEVFGDGSSARDYTFIDDAVDAIIAATNWQENRCEVVNVGSGKPISIMQVIASLEQVLKMSAAIVHLPSHPCDVPLTHADLRHAKHVLGYSPAHSFETGLQVFAEWFRVQQRRAA